MSETTHHFGFRIQGSPEGDRKRVEAGVAFRAYCQCDEKAVVDAEGYLSAFQFDDAFRAYLAEHGTTRGFAGSTWSPFVWFDVDRDEASGGIDRALADTRQLVNVLDDRFGVSREVLVPFLSGGKGFHVGLPTSLWQPQAGENFHAITRQFAEMIASEANVAIDSGVYDRVRAFRAPNSRHPRTGRHKRYVEVGILDSVTVRGLLDMATRPEPFDVPDVAGVESADFLVATWDKAKRSVEERDREMSERRAAVVAGTAAAKLNRQTRLFMAGEVEVGDRHRLLFSAAANFAELGCPLPAIREILGEPARDVGLAPRDIERAITNGYESVCRGAA